MSLIPARVSEEWGEHGRGSYLDHEAPRDSRHAVKLGQQRPGLKRHVFVAGTPRQAKGKARHHGRRTGTSLVRLEQGNAHPGWGRYYRASYGPRPSAGVGEDSLRGFWNDALNVVRRVGVNTAAEVNAPANRKGWTVNDYSRYNRRLNRKLVRVEARLQRHNAAKTQWKAKEKELKDKLAACQQQLQFAQTLAAAKGVTPQQIQQAAAAAAPARPPTARRQRPRRADAAMLRRRRQSQARPPREEDDYGYHTSAHTNRAEIDEYMAVETVSGMRAGVMPLNNGLYVIGAIPEYALAQNHPTTVSGAMEREAVRALQAPASTEFGHWSENL